MKAVFLCLATCVLGITSVLAANTAGTLDTTFGTNGVTVTTLVPTANDSSDAVPYALAFQTASGPPTSGDILVLAIVTITGANASTTEKVLAYTSGGVLDKDFGSGGIATLPQVLGPPAMAVQPNGQIVVVGGAIVNNANVIAAERLNANGTVDTTFGSGGLATTPLLCCGTEMSVVIEPASDDILACTQLEPTGRKQSFHTALARFTSSGAVDTTFGNDGTVNVAAVGGCAAVAVLTTAEILVENGGSAQFTSAGVPEASATGGTVAATGGSEAPSTSGSLFLASSDYLLAREVFTGEESRAHNGAAQVVRFTANGTQDSTFENMTFHFVGSGGDGIEAQPNAIAVQSNGDIVVVGLQSTESQSGTTIVNGLARLTPSGGLDTTFGSGGVITNIIPSGTDGLIGVAIDSEGRIVTVGVANSFTALAISRYLAQ